MGLRHLDKSLATPVFGCRVNVGAGEKLFGNIYIGADVNSVNIDTSVDILDSVPSGCTGAGIPDKIV